MIRRLMITSVLLLCLPLTVLAQELSSWQCLPEETIAAVRVPAGHDFIDALRQRTKLGAVLLSDERIERFKAIFREHRGGEWDQMVANMRKHGFEPDDFLQLFRGEAGTSLVIEQVDGRPLMVTLSWGEPGAEAAKRLIGAFATAADKVDADGLAVTREDIELAGLEVIHLTIPIVELVGDVDFDAQWQREPDDAAPPAFDDDDEDDDAGDDPIQPQVVNHWHVMVAQRGDRVLLATAQAQLPADVRAAIDAGDDVDAGQWDGVEQARGVFARFIAAHDGEGGAFAQRLVDVPGMDSALPGGETAIEMYASTERLVRLGQMFDTSGQFNAQLVDKLGLNGVGMFGWRMSLEGQNFRNGMFVQMPAPRRGIPAMFEQPEQEPKPPAWVPADVYQYQHISLDLGKLYTAIKQLAIEVGGEEIGFYFQMAEAQAMQMVQADMATVLSALGTRHSILTYVPTLAEVPGEAAVAAVPVQRTALVWELKDEMVWQRTMQMIGALAQAGGGQMRFAEEQGFTGWRYTQPPMEGGLFIGKGFMVLGIGSGAVENALASLSHPPDGDAALVNTSETQRGGDLLPLRAGLLYQIVNAARHTEAIREMMLFSFNGGFVAQAGMMDERQAALMRDLGDLFPSSEQMRGMIGVGVGQGWIDEHGLSVQSVLELPPAD
jgi:hypothetical protein